MKYEVIKYSQELKAQIVELQKHLWGPDVSVNTAYLEWKYEQNPYVNTPLIYVALCEGKVVGMRGIYGAKWQIGSPPQFLPALCAGDLVIAPEHRNRGLFTMIMKTALDDMAGRDYNYVFNLSSSPMTYLGSLTMGWRSIGDLQTMSRKTWTGIMKDLWQSYAKKSPFSTTGKKRQPFYFLDKNQALHQSKLSRNISIESAPRTEEMSELVRRIYCDGRIRHVRDQKYFAWRFNNPRSLYRFLFWRDTRLDGYLILQTKLYKNQEGVNIVDWEAVDSRVRSDLLQAAIYFGKFNVIRVWSATLSEHERLLLQNNGFSLLKQIKGIAHYLPTVLVRHVRDDMLKTDWIEADLPLLELSNWDLRMIDSDGY